MRVLKHLTLILLIAFMFPACLTLHEPNLISNTIEYLPPSNSPRIEATVSRNYFLAFGGANKEGMMEEALKKISIDYAGYLPYTLENITADQAKTSVFLIYTKHKLQLSANMNFKYNGYLNKSSKAILEKQRYGFNAGDIVYYSGYGYNAPTICIVTLALSKDDVVLKRVAYFANPQKEIDQVHEIQRPSSLLQLVEAPTCLAKKGERVAFFPIGYDGPPLKGEYKEALNNKTAYIILNEQSKNAWLNLGGTLTTEGGIHAPFHRILPQEKAHLLIDEKKPEKEAEQ